MKPWTEAHEREAALALLDEARTLLLDRDDERARDAANEAVAILADCPDHAGASADNLRITAKGLGLNQRRILRRVRGIAEGGLVRETVWYATRRSGARLAFYLDLVEAREAISAWRRSDPGSRLVRVTRIRRRSS